MAAELDIDALREIVRGPGHRLVAVDGCGGSGKSTLARRLADAGGLAVVEMDDFYLPTARRVAVPELPGANFDLTRLTEQVLVPAGDGRGARYQRYDWDEDALGEWVTVPPDVVVVVEGVYSTSAGLRDRYTLRVWVETPYDVRLARGVARDGEDMRATWVEEWMPAEARYVAAEDPATHAHVVVDGSGGPGDEPEFVVLRSEVPGITAADSPAP